MKRYIALGGGLLLTLGTAVASTLIYGHGQSEQVSVSYQPGSVATNAAHVTPEMIAIWKASAASTDYVAPKVPI